MSRFRLDLEGIVAKGMSDPYAPDKEIGPEILAEGQKNGTVEAQ